MANARRWAVKVVWRVILLSVIILFFILSIPTVLERMLPLSFSELIVYYGTSANIDPSLIAAIIQVESSFRPNAISPKGAVGLMQLMPDTARWVAEQRGMPSKELNLLDPELNVQLGVYYLQYLLQRFPTESSALAAYNGGPTNVKRWLEEDVWDGSWLKAESIPFTETRQYVKKVWFRQKLYRFFYQEELMGRGAKG